MLCTVRVHRADDQDGEVFPFQLEIIVQSPAENTPERIQDEANFPSVDALLETMRILEIEESMVQQADVMLHDETQMKVGHAIQANVYLSPHLLNQAGFYLHP